MARWVTEDFQRRRPNRWKQVRETIARTTSAHRTAKRALEKAEAAHAAAMASGDESAADEASKRREACAIDVQRTAREVVVAPRAGGGRRLGTCPEVTCRCGPRGSTHGR